MKDWETRETGLKIAIVDPTLDNEDPLVKRLQKSSRIEWVCCTSYLHAAKILTKSADLLIFDPTLTGTGGSRFLEELIAVNQHPGVILLSSMYGSAMMQDLFQLGVAACMMKPIEPSTLLRQIEEWADGDRLHLGENQNLLRNEIKGILLDLGMEPLSGYYDCCNAVEWICRRGNVQGKITKELYPFLDGVSQKQKSCAERNIRYAIEKAWKNADRQRWEHYLGAALRDGHKPSNKSFLCSLAEYLRKNGLVADAV